MSIIAHLFTLMQYYFVLRDEVFDVILEEVYEAWNKNKSRACDRDNDCAYYCVLDRGKHRGVKH